MAVPLHWMLRTIPTREEALANTGSNTSPPRHNDPISQVTRFLRSSSITTRRIMAATFRIQNGETCVTLSPEPGESSVMRQGTTHFYLIRHISKCRCL
jgi:hypothetical protein